MVPTTAIINARKPEGIASGAPARAANVVKHIAPIIHGNGIRISANSQPPAAPIASASASPRAGTALIPITAGTAPG